MFLISQTISEKTAEVRSFGQISPLGVKLIDEQCSAPNVSEGTSVNYSYEKDNTCSSREQKSAIVSTASDEKKSRRDTKLDALVKKAFLKKKKGEDCDEILSDLLKVLSIPSEEEMEDDEVQLQYEDSDEDVILNMAQVGSYEELATRSGEEEVASSLAMGGEEEVASSPARVEEEEGDSSQHEILSPLALERAVVEQISMTPSGGIPDFLETGLDRDTISDVEYQRTILVRSWHRYFAILQVLRAGGVLDENINWAEMVTLHYGQCKPRYYRFRDMVLSSDIQRFDNVEDILQEAYLAGSLNNLPHHHYQHLLDSIELAKTFARRNRMFDSVLIRETGPSFIMKRFRQVARRVPRPCTGSDLHMRGQAELEFFIDPILNNAQRRQTMDSLRKALGQKSQGPVKENQRRLEEVKPVITPAKGELLGQKHSASRAVSRDEVKTVITPTTRGLLPQQQ